MINPLKAIKTKFSPESARKVAAAVSWMLGAIGLVLAIGTAMYACYSLGVLFKVGTALAVLVSGISVITLVLHGTSVMAASNNAGRLINAIFFGVWAMALLVITAAYFWLVATGSIGTNGVIDFAKLDKAGGNVDLVDAGQSVYAFSAALPLLTILLGVIVPRVSASPIHDQLHATMGHAWSGWALNIASIAAAAYGGFHILTFGGLIGMSGFAPIFAAVVLDVAFLGAKARLTSLFKIRQVRKPLEDVEFVALAVLCFIIGGYALLCNWGVTRLEPLKDEARRALIESDGLVRLTVDAYGILAPVVLLLLLGYSVAVLMAQAQLQPQKLSAAPSTKGMPQPAARFARDTVDEMTTHSVGGSPVPPTDTTTTRTCEECGKTFIGSGRAKFCSERCKQRAKRRRAKGSATGSATGSARES